MAATSSLPLARRLLRASLPHVPQYGFTLRAAEAALSSALAATPDSGASSSRIPKLSETEISKQEAEDLLRSPSIVGLFGPLVRGKVPSETHFTTALYDVWDQESLHRAVERFKEHGRDAGTAGKGKGKAKEEGPARYADVVQALEERLLISAEVRAHLLEALSVLSSSSLNLPHLLPSRFTSLLPQNFRLPSSIPTPVPLLKRCTRLADELSSAVSWRDVSYGPAWYAHRARLGAAYALAEVHLSSPTTSRQNVSAFYDDGEDAKRSSTFVPPRSSPRSREELEFEAAPSLELFRRVAWGKETSIASDARRAAHVVREVGTWGGRGWLGVFRSRGW